MRSKSSWHDETRALDEAARRSAAGSFLHLSHGYTHFETGITGTAPDIALVHGFSAPYFIWDPTFQALVTEGWNPLRYDLYGRGYSDRPRIDYNLDMFVGQLLELLDDLGVREASLIGLSMGGMIAAAFTVRHPSRVRKLVLIDPAGVRALPSRTVYRIAVLPGIGELLAGLIGASSVIRGVAATFFESGDDERFQAQYRAQMEFRGFKRAILSTIRNHMLEPTTGLYKELGGLAIPTMLLWGERDRMVPFGHSRFLLTLLPGAIFHAIPACGHIPHFEKPELVNPLLSQFLRGENVPHR